MIKKGLILFFAFIFIFFAFSTYAQIMSENIVLTINPKYPQANEEVKASISSYMTDLNRAMIIWIINGTVASQGVGKKEFSFRTGASEFQTTLEVKIETMDGSSIIKKTSIIPVNIDLLWEAPNSYVPPFYKGKALIPAEGIIKMVAIPNSKNVGGFSYSWVLDNKNKLDSSGYGKNYYIFQNSFLETKNTIQVKILNLSGDDLGEGTIIVQPSNPKILFYRKDPVFGTKWEQALTNGFFINPNGESIVVEPYYFSPKNLDSGDLKLSWTLGENSINTPSPKNELGIKPEAGQSGSSKIKVSIENIKTLFLSMEKEINVNF